MTRKRCRACQQVKELSRFPKSKMVKSGRAAQCSDCKNRYQRERFHLDPRPNMISSARTRARKHGVPFDLKASDLVMPTHCPVLGLRLKSSSGACASADSPTLDRLIPAKGYVKGNVAIISFKANTIKSDATSAEIRRVAQWLDNQLETYS